MKQIYLLRHKHVPNWAYVGATSEKYLSSSFGKKWLSKHKKNTVLAKALRCSEREDWSITQILDFSPEWKFHEAWYIDWYSTYVNGLNSTASGASERTPKNKAASAINCAKVAQLRAKPVICCDNILFDSAAEAARQLGIDSSRITKCCLGKANIAGGFRWRFAHVK